MENVNLNNIIQCFETWYFRGKPLNHVLYATSIIFTLLQGGHKIQGFDDIDTLLDPSPYYLIICVLVFVDAVLKTLYSFLLTYLSIKFLKCFKQVSYENKGHYLLNIMLVYAFCVSITYKCFQPHLTKQESLQASFLLTFLFTSIRWILGLPFQLWTVICSYEHASCYEIHKQELKNGSQILFTKPDELNEDFELLKNELGLSGFENGSQDVQDNPTDNLTVLDSAGDPQIVPKGEKVDNNSNLPSPKKPLKKGNQTVESTTRSGAVFNRFKIDPVESKTRSGAVFKALKDPNPTRITSQLKTSRKKLRH